MKNRISHILFFEVSFLSIIENLNIRYAKDINSTASREVLTNLLSRPEANNALRAAGHGFKEAVKYYLPKLLLQPVWHCFLYFHYIKVHFK